MKYFTIDEFRCHHCDELPEYGMNPVLLAKLDKLREAIGCPIYISSGYRCPEHNADVGGVMNSQHIFGNAADIYTDAYNINALADMAETIGFDGIGIYEEDEFIHVDVRDNGHSPGEYRW